MNDLYNKQLKILKEQIESADAIVIGAGAGLSTSAGFTYSGDRFKKYFFDFEEKYHFHDMYTGGFFVMHLAPEISWAYWARNIYINRYVKAPKPVYEDLLELVHKQIQSIANICYFLDICNAYTFGKISLVPINT